MYGIRTAKQPLVDSIDNIRWLLGYVTKILRGSFAPVLVHSRSPLCFARMRLAPMRVSQIVLQNARFSSFATSRPNWINPELKGISKRACYVNRKQRSGTTELQKNKDSVSAPFLLPIVNAHYHVCRVRVTVDWKSETYRRHVCLTEEKQDRGFDRWKARREEAWKGRTNKGI